MEDDVAAIRRLRNEALAASVARLKLPGAGSSALARMLPVQAMPSRLTELDVTELGVSALGRIPPLSRTLPVPVSGEAV